MDLTSDEKQKWRWWFALIIMPAITIAMSATSAYLTAQEMMTRFDERLQVVEKEVMHAEDERDDLQRDLRTLSEGVVRVETKIDLLLDKVDK